MQQQPRAEPKDFNLEYAQLIAKQFPIHDEQGNLIDYSNINEFQLELLALHEEYGEETNLSEKRRIFNQLQIMNEKEFFRCKKLGIPYLKSIQVTQHDRYVPKPMPKIRDRPFGNHVGKEGGNPEYKKTVI
jgi:hypothetical protein